MKFQIGDKVSVLDDDIIGVVKRITAAIVIIETEDGFEMEFTEDELVIEHTMSSKLFSEPDMTHIIKEKEQSHKPKSVRVKPKERYQPKMEVDLHIHQLTNHYKGMSNFDILNLQLDTAKRQLEFAIHKRIQKVVFIHGVGEGVLKAELEYLFKRYDNVKFYPADYQKYGLGATEIYIYQNTPS
ncbi:Smr/MutS family protein [Psychroserpens sp.]|uniref:Smr/MutS family protein n=1 Tax=Psychroserpens sp. TaxID=2020870 RepID=UPI001B2D3051|nr:Smr/MutS family protein [Psychroserpens sp.]MBO6607307.1 DNA mismatch repair protein MutS [Psychroserpens sp.]MBO6631487.1 DNA mismatch repair protein MutS [Psychroserpens sp.]MBO6654617.1 DNA mismatch repair protein MutS [Psychroserpens sp.]MBO6681036.1 DNA mismatch repair protein MutS [Psychroserpens sp.]MBO6750009.1 DNA mismatch repair protein MutS [Psychroserpens sp.]